MKIAKNLSQPLTLALNLTIFVFAVVVAAVVAAIVYIDVCKHKIYQMWKRTAQYLHCSTNLF